MKIRAGKGRMEIIFPVILFLVFTLSALFVILYAARTYQHIVYESDIEYDKSTSLSYIAKKIHAQDSNGNIDIGELNGIPALIMHQEIQGASYSTYIYEYNGELRELFCADDLKNVNPQGGTILFAADSFIPEFVNDNLISLKITNGKNQSVQLVSLFSEMVEVQSEAEAETIQEDLP